MATGKLGVVGEHDWLAVTLQADQSYLFTVTGLTGDGTVEVLPASLGGDNFAINSVITPGATAATENVWLTPTTAGTYYVDVSDPNTIGTYSVSAVTEPNDFPNNTTTTGTVTVNGAATTGTLGVVGEHDWLAVTLQADQSYLFTVTGLTGYGTVEVLPAPLGGDNFAINSVITPGATAATENVWLTPTTAGTYYVDVSDPNTIGTYSVSAVTEPNDFPNNTTTTGTVTVNGAATTGKLGVVGEHDWLAVTLQADQSYLFTVTGLTGDGTVEVLPASLGGDNFAINSVITPGATAATENVWLTPTTAGTYYVDVSDPNTIGTYSVSAVTEPNDFPNTTTTTGAVSVNGAATTGTLGVVGEHDWLAVTLQADQSYLFTVTGLTGYGTVEVLPAPLGGDNFAINSVITPGATAATENVWLTPTTAGTYYVDVSDPNTIGTYSVSAVTEPNDFPNNTTTTGTVTVNGAATTGKLGVVGEHDWLAVTLQADQSYLFTVTGLTGDGTVEVLPASLGGDNFAINSVITPGATAATENVWLTPTTAGTYYVDVSDPNTIGTYSVSAVTEPNDFPNTTTTTGAVSVMCFVVGTRIATQTGEMPVERLSIGDAVLTVGGEARPIVWIGTGRVLATRGRRNAATPVIVRKGALADNVPHRDLHVTKGHSLYIDGVLIPVEFLVNHRSILWDDRAQEVTVYHLELDTHDVLIADGAPAESYRDDGNRWLFQNANSGWDLPQKVPCAPVLTGGPVVDTVWKRLLDRAGPRRSLPLTDDPDLHLLVDGVRLDPVMQSGEFYIFNFRQAPAAVRIISRAASPQELGLARDSRSLGVAMRRIVVRQRTRFQKFEPNDALLAEGFHAFEANERFRWTDGDASLPLAMFAGFSGSVEVLLHIGATTQYIEDGDVFRVA